MRRYGNDSIAVVTDLRCARISRLTGDNVVQDTNGACIVVRPQLASLQNRPTELTMNRSDAVIFGGLNEQYGRRETVRNR